MRPIVTVVIPAYNAEKWIDRAISSIVRQTMYSWELIIVDDGSTDRTVDTAKRHENDRIVVVRQGHAGPSAARNRGIELSCGKYVAFLDADDEYAPSFLYRTTSLLERNEDCIGCTTNVIRVNRDGSQRVCYKPNAIIAESDGLIDDLLSVRIRERSFPMLYLVLRSALCRELGPFAPENIAGAEEELLLRWLPKGRFGYVNEPLVYYYDTPGSLIKDVKRSTWSKTVVWSKTIPRDKELQACLPSYRKFRDIRLFRAALVAVATGCFDDAERIGRLWPLSLGSIYWWLGYPVARMPRPLKLLLHRGVRWIPMVKYRNQDHHGKDSPA